jgi:hypothetical protein
MYELTDKDKARLKSLMTSYQEESKYVNILLLGEEGVGKTHLLQTCRQPLYIDSFDPGGTKTIRNFLLKSGSIVDTRWEKCEPTTYMNWEKNFLDLKRSGFFEAVGTYVIDSFSLFAISLQAELVRRYRRPDGILEIKDWNIINNAIRDTFLVLFQLPCDVVVTGHLSSEKDEVSGRVTNKIAATPSTQGLLPKLFDEIYVLIADNSAKGISRKVLTQNDGRYKARTRIGNGKLEVYEEAHICNILKKAGIPVEHKGRLI